MRQYLILFYWYINYSTLDKILDALDPLKRFVSHRFYQQHCSSVTYENKQFITKLLRRLRSNTDDIIILDNSPFAYFYNPEVGIPIGNFYGDMWDSELYPLLVFIGTLETMQHRDMVTAIAKYLKKNKRWEKTKVLNFLGNLCGSRLKEHYS